jgi:hypothetical protein
MFPWQIPGVWVPCLSLTQCMLLENHGCPARLPHEYPRTHAPGAAELQCTLQCEEPLPPTLPCWSYSSRKCRTTWWAITYLCETSQLQSMNQGQCQCMREVGPALQALSNLRINIYLNIRSVMADILPSP